MRNEGSIYQPRLEMRRQSPIALWPVIALSSVMLLALPSGCRRKSPERVERPAKDDKTAMQLPEPDSSRREQIGEVHGRPAPSARVATRETDRPSPARQMPASEFKPTVAAPSFAALYPLVRSPEREDVRLGKVVALGQTRFTVVATGRQKGSDRTWFRLLVVEAAGGPPKIVSDFLVDEPPFSTKQGKGRVGAQLRVGDFDFDGLPEAQVNYRYPVDEGGDGEVRRVA
ncbi:MAG: hypothetical protein RBU30_16975, partial [Polyangia bacterium]|nr:hypothetical protein [Polyangia bacterium]